MSGGRPTGGKGGQVPPGPDPREPGGQGPAAPVYRPIADGEHAAVASLIMLGFGQPAEAASYAQRTRPDELRVLDVGGEPVAALKLGRLGQWWLGRRAPSAQVYQLATAPEHGGRGYASALLRGLLGELHEQGVPTVTLFASTLSLYRGVGFECAGTWTMYEIRAEHLPRSTRPYRARRVPLEDPGGLAEVRALYDRVAATRHGALDRDEPWWQRLIGPDRERTALFVLDGPDGHAGWALLRFDVQEGWRTRLSVRDWGCLPGAERALFGLLGGYGPLDGKVTWTGPDPDPGLLVLPEERFSIAARDHWLLRVVDLPAALSARPYPEALRGTVRLRVDDPRCPWNSGHWLLEVADGRGRVQPISSAGMRLEARGLAALFTGFLDPDELARVGLLSDAQPRELSFLRAAFSTRRPWTAEHY
jgi:predicted acetyltransferase